MNKNGRKNTRTTRGMAGALHSCMAHASAHRRSSSFLFFSSAVCTCFLFDREAMQRREIFINIIIRRGDALTSTANDYLWTQFSLQRSSVRAGLDLCCARICNSPSTLKPRSRCSSPRRGRCCRFRIAFFAVRRGADDGGGRYKTHFAPTEERRSKCACNTLKP